MPAAKLKKAIINTRYPTVRDLADILQVPKVRVEELAEELMQSQRKGLKPYVSEPRPAKRGTRKLRKRST